MRLTEGSAGARILAFGGYRPARVVTNDEMPPRRLHRRVDPQPGGHRQPQVAGPDETVADMAVAAGGKALAASGLSPEDIDLVIVATCTPECRSPRRGPVAARLGIVAPGAFDISAACAGFCYALARANDAVRTGTAGHVLVVGVEKLSHGSTGPTGPPHHLRRRRGRRGGRPVGRHGRRGIGPVALGQRRRPMADKIDIKDRDSFIVQEGQAVFRWAAFAMAPVGPAGLRAGRGHPAELDVFVPHQANMRIIDAMARKLGAPQALVARDIVDRGQHLGGLHPAGPVPDARARRGLGRLPRC